MLAVGDLGHLLLCRIQALVPLADDAEALDHRNVLDAEEHQELGNGNSSCAAAVDNHLDLIHLAAGQTAGVEQSRTAADSGAVLVIVEYRNIADLFKSALDLKAARSRDILEVDAAERAGDQLNGAYDLVHILGSHTKRERVHVSERLEQRALALHDRHAGNRTDIAQTEHRGAIRDDSHEIMTTGILVAQARVVLDLEARLGNTRRVRDRQIVLAVYLTAGHDLNLAAPFFVCLQCAFLNVHVLFLRYRSCSVRRKEFSILPYYTE